MTLRRHIAYACCQAVLAATMTGCFTGVESTPRITADDARHSGVSNSPEMALSAKIGPERPSDWTPGKQWVVTDNKISLIFTPTVTEELPSDTLTLVGLQPITTITGEQAAAIALACGERTYIYMPGVAWNALEDRDRIDIPFAIELSQVAQADSLLRGHRYYIKTPKWRDGAGRPTTGLRHVPVTITAVTAGTESSPLMVHFTADGDTAERTVYLTCGSRPTANRNFDRVFTLSDPRREYPAITDATWQHIIHSEVVEGMTRDECRLALGTPTDLRRGATTGAQIEHWSYDDGVYLIFEDGILTRFRR